MTARRVKQIIYGAFYLLIIIGIGVAVYYRFFYAPPPPPCVDCIAASQAQPLVVGDFQAFTSGSGRYTFLARVENHNSDFAAKSFKYSFNLYDASGTVLQSFSAYSFIYPSEVKYVVVPNVTNAVAFDHAGLTIESPYWVPATEMGIVPKFNNPLALTGNSISSSTVTVTGGLTDSDLASFTPVYLVAVFYDASGTAVGASQAQLDSIAPNQSEPFSVSYPVVANLNPGATKVYAYALRP